MKIFILIFNPKLSFFRSNWFIILKVLRLICLVPYKIGGTSNAVVFIWKVKSISKLIFLIKKHQIIIYLTLFSLLPSIRINTSCSEIFKIFYFIKLKIFMTINRFKNYLESKNQFSNQSTM